MQWRPLTMWLLGCGLPLVALACVLMHPRRPAVDPLDGLHIEREFRAAWVATVANIDWPSAPGLPVAEQQQEALDILDVARHCGLNAIILQVRPHCDALYASRLEPWSYYLTGVQGQGPEPAYDPLSFWTAEAHARGLELHAWFNPYRAHHPAGGPVTAASVVHTRPELVRELGSGYYWLDPALEETQDHSLSVIMDVVQRYDVDGVHIDDYFYPYPAYNGNRDFPDDAAWQAYLRAGGRLGRADWRRQHVSGFVRRLYRAIKTDRPHVKFGVSPYGIWRPGHPESIRGLDQHEVLYADARKWLQEGWMDYMAPQLYWRIQQVEQSYPVLLGWWTRQNRHERHLWPGIISSRIRDQRDVDETINQIMVARGFLPAAPGHVHFSMKALLHNRSGIVDSLRAGPYAHQALVPPSPWLDTDPPAPPQIEVRAAAASYLVKWQHGAGKDVFRWLVAWQTAQGWQYVTRPQAERSLLLSAGTAGPEEGAVPWNAVDRERPQTDPPSGGKAALAHGITAVAVLAVDRLGNVSAPGFVTLPVITCDSARTASGHQVLE